jgi:hypothetical protein
MTPGEPFSPKRMFVGVFIPDALLACRDLSLGAKLLWAVLARMAGDHGHCWPNQQTLAQACGCSAREIKRRLRELADYGLIRVVRGGQRRSNTYQFLWHQIFETGDNLSHQTEPNGDILSHLRGPNGPLYGDQTVPSMGTKRSPEGSPQVTDPAQLNPKNRPPKREMKREMKREIEKQASVLPHSGQPLAAGQLVDLAVERLAKALEPHATAIGQPITEQLIDSLLAASHGQPLAAASLISKIIHRRFSDHAPAGYRQPWPDSLNYWIRVVREELRDLA